MAISSKNELTPVEFNDGIYYKRDDLYMPFEELPELSGGKVRQMQMLIDTLKQNGHWNFNGILTYTGATSPQALIVAKIAFENNLPCIIGVGVKEQALSASIEKHLSLKLARQYNAEIVSLAAIGYNTVLREKSQSLAREKNYFLIDFGINSESNAYAVIRGITAQVLNLPDDLDNLIITCGSGVSMAAIIVGLKLFAKKVKRVIGIQISGFDRKDTINKIISRFDIEPTYEFFIDYTYDYKTKVQYSINEGFELSEIYEAKAMRYFLKHKAQMNISDNDKTLFWCIGNNNFIHRNKPKIKKAKGNEIRISAQDFKKQVNPCSENMIKNHCLAQCCRNRYKKLEQPVIIVLDDETEKLKKLEHLGYKIQQEENLLSLNSHDCVFQDRLTNYCSIHGTELKPFGCKIMPLTINRNTVTLQKYFFKMDCQTSYFAGVQRVPFYKGFRQSLEALFGEEETKNIIQKIEAGEHDITVQISQENQHRLKQVKTAIDYILKKYR